MSELYICIDLPELMKKDGTNTKIIKPFDIEFFNDNVKSVSNLRYIPLQVFSPLRIITSTTYKEILDYIHKKPSPNDDKYVYFARSYLGILAKSDVSHYLNIKVYNSRKRYNEKVDLDDLIEKEHVITFKDLDEYDNIVDIYKLDITITGLALKD